MPVTRDLLASLLVCALLPSTACAGESASLRVTFTPYQLGQSTSVAFDIAIAAPAHKVPAPLTEVTLRYPSDIGLALSGLGLATCSQRTLEEIGPQGCPSESHMGQGSATAAIPVGTEIIHESATVTIVRAPEERGHIAMLFNVAAETPVDAEVVFPGVLLPSLLPNDESIHITVPIVEGLAGGPDVSVTKLDATFGPRGLIYYEHTHGKYIPYTPNGILLPNHCPPGGFHFAAALSFADATRTLAQATIRCPSGASA